MTGLTDLVYLWKLLYGPVVLEFFASIYLVFRPFPVCSIGVVSQSAENNQVQGGKTRTNTPRNASLTLETDPYPSNFNRRAG